MDQLDKMELSNDFQYVNSLNIFSLTLGPFEKDATKEQDNDGGHAEDDDEEFEALQREADELGAGISYQEDDVLPESDEDDLNDFATLKQKATQIATKRATKTSGETGAEMPVVQAMPKVLERDVVIDDFIRNFLQRFEMY